MLDESDCTDATSRRSEASEPSLQAIGARAESESRGRTMHGPRTTARRSNGSDEVPERIMGLAPTIQPEPRGGLLVTALDSTGDADMTLTLGTEGATTADSWLFTLAPAQLLLLLRPPAACCRFRRHRGGATGTDVTLSIVNTSEELTGGPDPAPLSDTELLPTFALETMSGSWRLVDASTAGAGASGAEEERSVLTVSGAEEST